MIALVQSARMFNKAVALELKAAYNFHFCPVIE